MWTGVHAAFLVLAIALLASSCDRRDEPPANASAPTSEEAAELRLRVDELEQRFARLKGETGQASEGPQDAAALDLQDPEVLFEQAKLAIERRDLGLAYRLLGTIHALHPESPEDADAYRVAAGLFVRLYFRSRFEAPDSVWMTAEPTFMFYWLAGFFGDEFPQQAVDDLLKGVPHSLGIAFLEFARSHPKAMKGWEVTFDEDNGLVEEIRGQWNGASDVAAGATEGG